MKRYLQSIRTAKGNRSRSDIMRDDFQRQLIQDANTLLQTMSQQYLQDLNTQTAQLLQNMTAANAAQSNPGIPGAPNATMSMGDSLVTGVGQFIASGVRYLAIKPRSNESTYESSRSQEVEARFRVSQAQALAEANTKIAKGNKNL